MSVELGFVGGVVGEFVGTGQDRDARAWALWTARARVGEAARLSPLWRRRKQRVIVVFPRIASVRSVRDVLWSVCRDWHVAEFGECVAACASELVTNAIVHATWPDEAHDRLRLSISKTARTLMVEVCDPDPEWPHPRAFVDWEALEWDVDGSAGESGLGLKLVRARVMELGGEFGCVSGTGGKGCLLCPALAASRAWC